MLKQLQTSALILSSTIAFAAPAMAYDAGDILMRVGTATVTPESISDDLDQVAGAQASANSNTQLGISGTYMLTNNIGVEVLGATPFTHKLKGKGGLNGVNIGEVKHLPPTVSAQYYFMDSTSPLQPYVGAGLNITVFFDEEVHSDLSANYQELDLDESVGIAVQAGLDYSFDEKMFVNASVMYAKIGTTATLDGTAGKLTVDYDLDPMVYRLNFGYKF
ncbi:outer membrane beta-barrel protein [Oceaniserpentilla sp. 4NH20-0058]|uniref:OmpW/AlkL family protein n=1 Tax=Oceaniserpentilla sp. 4NH20-0058 TaxID=3127660 RepID=UPI003103FA16